MGKIVLVTGASSGMGEATARLLNEKGYKVYAAARSVDQMKPLEVFGIKVLPLDLTDADSIVACVNSILKQDSRIDILINNAGYGSYGAVEDVPISEGRRQFEVNLFGLAHLTQLVLPQMRQNGFGRIVNISSMGGKMYTPFGAWYHATKHALEGWSDCLRLEVKPFGIDVVLVEPGVIATPWGVIAANNLKNNSLQGAYAQRASRTANTMTTMYANPKRATDPLVLANVIVKAATANKPKTRYVKGAFAKPVLFLRKILSDRSFDKLINAMDGRV
jgi:short-subunit dehydrogenase